MSQEWTQFQIQQYTRKLVNDIDAARDRSSNIGCGASVAVSVAVIILLISLDYTNGFILTVTALVIFFGSMMFAVNYDERTINQKAADFEATFGVDEQLRQRAADALMEIQSTQQGLQKLREKLQIQTFSNPVSVRTSLQEQIVQEPVAPVLPSPAHLHAMPPLEVVTQITQAPKSNKPTIQTIPLEIEPFDDTEKNS